MAWRKLTPERVRAARLAWAAGESERQIADREGVDRSAIRWLLEGRTWADTIDTDEQRAVVAEVRRRAVAKKRRVRKAERLAGRLAGEYRQGGTVPLLAAKHGLSDGLVMGQLRKAGVRCDKRGRAPKLVTWKGETLSLNQWAKRLGMGKRTIAGRIKAGWPVDKAFTTPPHPAFSRNGKLAAGRQTGVPVTFKGKTLTVAEWARRLGVNENTIARRLRQGWPAAEALTAPTRTGYRRTVPRLALTP